MIGSKFKSLCNYIDGIADDLGQVHAIVGAELGDDVVSKGVGVCARIEFDGVEGRGTVEHDGGVGRYEHSVLAVVRSG
jgi:hypothetical protein